MTLDTRHNLLSVVLIGAIAALAVFAGLAFLLLGGASVESIEPRAGDSPLVDRPVARSPELAPMDAYSAIVERPVFFADRALPVVELAGENQAEPEPELEPEPEPEVEIPELEATVAGIIITPEVRLAMVTDNDSDETLVLREGMAMAGEKSAWKVARIAPRSVRFATDGGESRNLELQVETDALERGARPAPRRTAANDNGGEQQPAPDGDNQQDAQAEARARAEEIRRRVAERRAQLRAEAERRARENNDG